MHFDLSHMPWRGYLVTLSAGLIGALLFLVLGLPLPWMLGALFGAFVAANIPALPVNRPTGLSSSVRMILGVAVGSAFTPAVLEKLDLYLLSILAMIPFLILVIWLGFQYFTHIAGLDRRSGFFCALPGGMLEMTMICEAYGADIRQVALIHVTRVLLIVYTVPFAIQHLTPYDLSGRMDLAPPLSAIPLGEAALITLTALIGWALFRRFRLPGASIVGPMISCGLLYGSGLVSARVPDELINLAQLILGAGVGAAFSGIAPRAIMNAVTVTLGYYLLLMIAAMGSAVVVSEIAGVPLIATVLAYVPGGQAEMNVIALLVGVAVPYIALHHAVRMFLVMTIAPPLSNRILGPPPKAE